MKKCPNCNQLLDDSFDFCLNDGTRLVPERGVIIGGYETSGEIPTQYIQQPPAVPPVAAGGMSNWLFLLIGLLLATLVFGGIGVVFLLYQGFGPGAKPAANETVKIETPTPISNKADTKNTNVSTNLSATPPPFATPTVTPPPATPPPATPLPPPTPVTSRVTTSRIKFARGAVTSAVSGSLVEGETKNYVLACRAGQQMTARLSTSNRCVTFTNGSNTISTYTRQGDNSIAVRNTCGGSGGYRIDISIF